MTLIEARLQNLAQRMEEETAKTLSEAQGGMEKWVLLKELSSWCEAEARKVWK